MVHLSHPAVNAYTRNAALALASAGLLDEFCTTLGWGDGGWLVKQLPASLRSEWSRRQVPPLVAAKVRRHGAREAMRLLATRLHKSSVGSAGSVTQAFSTTSVYGSHDRFVSKRIPSRKGLRAVYCGEDAALDTFTTARQLGLKCVYDLPIGYWRSAQRLFTEERELMPEFARTLPGLQDSPAKLARKEHEAELADVIVACSPFVAATLHEAGFPESKVHVIPYGAPAPSAHARAMPRHNESRPLRLLFAGSIGQRKGIGYLLHAMQAHPRQDVELTVMGSFTGDRDVFRPYAHLFHYEPPRDHASVLELMRQHDVLVLPSIFEGFALVILEAMANGLPVIITPNTGGTAVVQDGTEGFVVPIRSSEALAEKIHWMADHREETRIMGESAAKRAALHGWEHFQQKLTNLVHQHLN